MQIEPNIQDPDGFYLSLMQAHENLSEQQSFEFNARLIFLLANQIGDAKMLADCLAAAAEYRPQADHQMSLEGAAAQGSGPSDAMPGGESAPDGAALAG